MEIRPLSLLPKRKLLLFCSQWPCSGKWLCSPFLPFLQLPGLRGSREERVRQDARRAWWPRQLEPVLPPAHLPVRVPADLAGPGLGGFSFYPPGWLPGLRKGSSGSGQGLLPGSDSSPSLGILVSYPGAYYPPSICTIDLHHRASHHSSAMPASVSYL